MRHITVLALFLGFISAASFAGDTVPADLRKKAEAAITKGTDFLVANQKEDGHWGKYKIPAIAALGAIALKDAPASDIAARDAARDKGMEFVLSYIQDTGGIHSVRRRFVFFKRASYPNYTTSIAILALTTNYKPEYKDILLAARDYLKSIQYAQDGVNKGGFGYGPGKDADMSNTAWSAEALHYSEFVETDIETKKNNKQVWSDVRTYLDKTQNLVLNDDGTVKSGDGGFAYESDDNKSKLVSSGSMTYMGLKSMIYAKVDRKDARVKGAMSFVKKNYTLDENPGQELKGYYYYLMTVVKALDAFGVDTITLENGTKVHWRKDVIEKFLSMQRDNGSWINEQGRYMESLPSLATSYALISLKIALSDKKKK